MGWVTVIGPAMEQVNYRLKESAGCSLHREGHEHDAQVEYRLGDGLDDEAQALVWIGEGLRDVGIEPGTVMSGDEDKVKAKALMSGVHPGTGEILVEPKLAVDPRGKLLGAPLVAAIAARAEASGGTVEQLLGGEEWAAKRYGRAERGVRREGEVHRVAYKDAARLAKAAGVDLADLYGAKTLAEARQFADAKVRTGHRGFDVTLDLPKSVSGLWSIAPPELAMAILDTHREAVVDGFASFEGWAGYTMTGHHGDGQSAAKVASSGMLGWMMPHQVARPVNGAAPDPHVHTHVVIAHLAHAKDGHWRTIGAGGRDVMRMAAAFDVYAKARFRALTSERFGLVWERDERTGQWEVVAIPAELREQLSKRGAQVARELEKLGLTPESATRMQAKTASGSSRESKTNGPGPGGELRAEWRRQVEATGARDGEVTGPDGKIVVEKLVEKAAPGWGPGDGPRPDWPGPTAPPMPPLQQLAAEAVETLTEHRKEFRRSDALVAVLDLVPQIATMADAEQLVDQVLAQTGLVAVLPEQGQTHLTHHARYTSQEIVRAERAIVESAAARYGQAVAVVPANAAAMAVGVFEAENGFTLGAEQRATVDRLLTAGHGVDAVIGVAGAGKTTLMSAARTGWQARGLVVAGASTAAVAAVNLEAEAGIASATLASWLQRIRTGHGLAGVDVMVVDEAAMCDDRQVAELVTAAAGTGTKIVLIGDPMQLRSPGVGGSFRAVHEIVDGTVLRENRRQRDQAERAALAQWRTGDHHGALLAWSEAGRVHVVEDGPSAIAAMLQRWDATRAQIEDPFERISRTLLMAGTNADVNKLNAGARAIRIAAGEITPGREYRLAGGGRIEISIGDVVMTRANDYRERRTKGAEADVLNGYRGIVTAADERGITVRWRSGAESALSTGYIAEGGVTLGYALTVAKAQGLTAEDAIVYGAGLDPNTLYPALSRDRGRVDLILPRTLVEDEATRIRLGEPATEAEALRRAINAYAASLTAREEPMVSVQLGQALPAVPEVEARRAAEPAAQPSAQTRQSRRAQAARATSAIRDQREQAAAARARAADPEAAQAIETAAQMFSGTPSERLARSQRVNPRRAQARAARPGRFVAPVPATAEQVRARTMARAGDRSTWPVMFTARWGTTPAADLAEDTANARRQRASWQATERAAAAWLQAEQDGRPGTNEAELLARRAENQDQAARIKAVTDAQETLRTAKESASEAKAEAKRLREDRDKTAVRTALRGVGAWRRRDEEIIKAQNDATDAADAVTKAREGLREALANDPRLETGPARDFAAYGLRYSEMVDERVAGFEQEFPGLLRSARERDAEQLAQAREQRPEAAANVEGWSARLAGLETEGARRAALTPAELAIEDAARGLRTLDGNLVDATRTALAAAADAPAGYQPWTARPFGQLTDTALATRLENAAEQVSGGQARAADLRETIEGALQAARDGHGDRMRQLREQGQAAADHARRDREADPIRTRETEAGDQSRALFTQARELDLRTSSHNAAWHMVRGTTQGAERDRAAGMREQAEKLRGTAAAARAELAAMPGGDPGRKGVGRDEHRRFQEDLPARAEFALREDERAADAREGRHRGHLVQAEGEVRQGQATIAAVQTERAVREQLPEPIAGAERVTRATSTTEKREDARAEAEARARHRAAVAAWEEEYPEIAHAEEMEDHMSYTYEAPSISHGLSL
jgi:conjugative relaxase-like TrwC/TraI family protein